MVDHIDQIAAIFSLSPYPDNVTTSGTQRYPAITTGTTTAINIHFIRQDREIEYYSVVIEASSEAELDAMDIALHAYFSGNITSIHYSSATDGYPVYCKLSDRPHVHFPLQFRKAYILEANWKPW